MIMTQRDSSNATMMNTSITALPMITTPTMRRTKTSILPDMESNVIEILGHYWPRVLHRENVNPNNKTSSSLGKKEDKKVKKAHRQRRRKSDIKSSTAIPVYQEFKMPTSPVFAPASPISSTLSSSFTVDSIPSLVLEEPQQQQQPRMFSTITGRPIALSKSNNKCGLLPGKSLRMMQRQRTQSHESVVSLD